MSVKYSIVESLLPDYKNTIRKLLNNPSLNEIYHSTLTKDTFENDEIKNINKLSSFITDYGTLVSGNFKTHNVLLQSIREFTVNSQNFDYNTVEEQIHVTDDEYNYNIEYVDYNKLWERGSLEGIEVWGLGKSDPQQMEVTNGELILRQTSSSNSTDLRQVLSLLPHLKNFIIQFETQLKTPPSTIPNCSITFRNSFNSFSDNNNTYQYVFGITANGYQVFGKGVNNQNSNSPIYTELFRTTCNSPVNTWVRVKIIVQDSNFKFYVNDTFLGEVNDTTYTNQGYIQFRIYADAYYSGTPPEQRFRNLQITNLDQLPKNTYVQSWSHVESNNVGNLVVLENKNYVDLTSSGGVLTVKYVRDYPSGYGSTILFDDFPVQKSFEYEQNLKVTNTVSKTQQVLGIYEISPHMYIQSNIQKVDDSKYIFTLERHTDNTLYTKIGKDSDNLQYLYQDLLYRRLSSFGITEDVNQFYNFKIRKVENNYKFYINGILVFEYTSNTSKQYNKVGIEIYDVQHSSSNPQTIQIKDVQFTVLDNHFQKYSLYNFGTQNIQTNNGVVELRKQAPLRGDMIYNFGVVGYIKSNSNVEKIEQLITDINNNPITPFVKTEIYQHETLQLQGYVQKIQTTGVYNLIIRIHTSTTLPSSNLTGDVYLSDPVLLEYVNTNIIDTQGVVNLIDQYEPGASQDWSKWTHWNSATYWYSTTQYDDPVWGKVFYGRAKRDVEGNTYISNYSPNIPVNVGVTYILSFYIKTSTDLTLSFLAYLTPDYGNTVVATATRTYSLRANEWTKVEMSLTPNTSSNVQYGVRFINIPDGQEFWIAYPQIVEDKYPGQDWSKWSHWGNTLYWNTNIQYDDPVFGKVFKGVAGNEYNKYLYDYYPYTFVPGAIYTMSQQGVTNLIDQWEPGASQDWSKWDHWNQTTYWYSTTQYDDPVWGKVFYGRARRDVNGHTYIYNYLPTVTINAGTTYIVSFYVKTNTDLVQPFRVYFTSVHTYNSVNVQVTRTYNLRANEWTRVELLFTPSQTYSNQKYGIEFVNVPDGQEFWIAYPQIVENQYPTQNQSVLAQYTMGIWLRGDTQWTGNVRFYVNNASTNQALPNGDQIKTITIDTNWKYFTWTVTPTITQVTTGGLGIEFQNLPGGYTLYAQLPKFEQNTTQTEFLPLPVYVQKSDYPFPIFNLNNQFDLRQNQDWTITFEYIPFNSDTQTLLSNPKTFTLFSLGTLNPANIKNIKEYNSDAMDFVKSLQFYVSQLLVTSNNLFVPYNINIDNLLVTNTQITLTLMSQFQHYSGENVIVTSTSPVTIQLNDFLFKKHLVIVTYSNTTKTLTTIVILSNNQILQTNIQIKSTVDDVMWTFRYLSNMNYTDGDLILGGVIDSKQLISSYKLQSFVFRPITIQNALYKNLTLVKNYYTNPTNLNTNVFTSITLGKDLQRRNSNGFYNVLIL